MKTKLYQCPECESTDILVYEETAFELNTGDYYCHSVKSHDSDAKVSCQYCGWEGERQHLYPNNS